VRPNDEKHCLALPNFDFVMMVGLCKNMLSQGLCALLAGGLNEPEGWHCVSVVSDEELKVAHPEGSPVTALSAALRSESQLRASFDQETRCSQVAAKHSPSPRAMSRLGARLTGGFDPLLPLAGLQHAQRGDDIAGRQVFRKPVSASSSLTMSTNAQLAPQSSGAWVPAKRSAIQAMAASALFIAAVPWPTPGSVMKVTRLPAAQSLPM
jgi:hypothetical protein